MPPSALGWGGYKDGLDTGLNSKTLHPRGGMGTIFADTYILRVKMNANLTKNFGGGE